MQSSHNLDLSPHGVAVSRRDEQLGFTHVLVTTWDLLQGLDVSLNYYIYIYIGFVGFRASDNVDELVLGCGDCGCWVGFEA
jgi:hypothetical protein